MKAGSLEPRDGSACSALDVIAVLRFPFTVYRPSHSMTTKVSHARSTVNSSRSSALCDLLQAPSCLASDPKSRYPFTVYRFSHTMKHRPFTHGSRLHGPRSATRCDVLPAPGSRLPAILRLTQKPSTTFQPLSIPILPLPFHRCIMKPLGESFAD